MAAAMVATPMVMTVAVRMPARIIPSASGKRTRVKNLRVSHAHGFGSFQHRGIDAGEPDVGVAQNGQQGVENQRDDGCAGPMPPINGMGIRKPKSARLGIV